MSPMRAGEAATILPNEDKNNPIPERSQVMFSPAIARFVAHVVRPDPDLVRIRAGHRRTR